MNMKLTVLAVSGLIALGGFALPANAAAIQAGGSIAATTPDIRAGASEYTEVRHRGWRHRRHHRHRGWRHRGGGASIEFHFGAAPRYRYAPAPRYRYRGPAAFPSAHVDWCYDRYRSYRLRDNSFQPYHGPRRQCHSPYY